MVKIDAVAVDIDGTITDDKRQICISAIKALRALEDKGIPTIIVTGNVADFAYATAVLEEFLKKMKIMEKSSLLEIKPKLKKLTKKYLNKSLT